MRICHVSRGACPRILKLAYVQKKAGHEIHWVGYTPPSYQTTLPFKYFHQAQEIRFGGIGKTIGELNDKVDIFHVHTHLFDTEILDHVRAAAKKKVVWDRHDNAAYQSDAPMLCPTEAFGGTVYKTYVPRDWWPRAKDPEYDMVIATGLSSVESHFRYWLPVFKTFKEAGIRIRCYTNSIIPDHYSEYAEMNGPIDVVDLLQEMSKARFGLCGTLNKGPIIDDAHPNKLYEYIAAGIPVVCLGKDMAMSKVVEFYKLGAVIEKAEDIVSALEYIETNGIRENVVENRARFIMDSQEPIVMNFYKKVLYG